MFTDNIQLFYIICDMLHTAADYHWSGRTARKSKLSI